MSLFFDSFLLMNHKEIDDEIEKKLDFISDIWNDYVWNYKFFQKEIHFDDDIKSNYYGHILRYFGDTLGLK